MCIRDSFFGAQRVLFAAGTSLRLRHMHPSFIPLRGIFTIYPGWVFVKRKFKATPHNSASRFGERFFAKPRFEKRRNTVCISSFSNRRIGGKDPAKRADAIVRGCLTKKSSAIGAAQFGRKTIKIFIRADSACGRARRTARSAAAAARASRARRCGRRR